MRWISLCVCEWTPLMTCLKIFDLDMQNMQRLQLYHQQDENIITKMIFRLSCVQIQRNHRNDNQCLSQNMWSEEIWVNLRVMSVIFHPKIQTKFYFILFVCVCVCVCVCVKKVNAACFRTISGFSIVNLLFKYNLLFEFILLLLFKYFLWYSFYHNAKKAIYW